MKNLRIELDYAPYFMLVAFLFTSSADVTLIDECATVAPYEIWSGLWYGTIALFAWIGSLLWLWIYIRNRNIK